MKKISAIIFDKDGTLFDFARTWGVWAQSVLDDLSEDEPDLRHRIADAIGFDIAAGRFDPDSVVIAGTPGDVVGALGVVLDTPPDQLIEILNHHATETRQVPAVDLSVCLSRLGHDRLLGVVTNDAEVPAKAHLEVSGIADHFAFVAGYDSGYGAKPDPGQLLAFCQATGANPTTTLMVGDSRHDLEAGRRAGMGCVGVLTGVASRDDLADLADVVLPDIGHLADWIAEQTGATS